MMTIAVDGRNLMSDLISRQAAIDALKHDEEYDEDIPNRADGVRDAIITISSLPSAQPEERMNKHTETHACDCISRQAAIMQAKNIRYDADIRADKAIDDVIYALEQMPSAQPDYTYMVVGNSKNGITMWYECAKCAEPVTIGDKYCRNCGRKFKNG